VRQFLRIVLHILVNDVAAVSLALCLATVVLWARSYGRWQSVIYLSRSGAPVRLEATCFNGSLTLFELHPSDPDRILREGWEWHSEPIEGSPRALEFLLVLTQLVDPDAQWEGLGIARSVGHVREDPEVGFAFTIVPAWEAAALLAVAPAAWAFGKIRRGVRRRRRAARNLCAACGYDLRATPDRCPECGTVPTP
jgi:hypothetical protein